MNDENSMNAACKDYLADGGEMGGLIRSFDWSSTVLGDPDQWPPNLLYTVSLLLDSRFPMFLWWGEDLIQFYNDAYRPSLGMDGKHPGALGQKGEECWPEIWPVIKPLIDGVMASGKATWNEDWLIPIYRNNQLEDVYWTFSYSRVKNSAGMAGGVLVTCFETTEKVSSTQKIQSTFHKLEANEAKLRYMLAGAPVAIGVFSGRDLIIESANSKILEVWDKTSEIIGKPLHVALPELEGQAFLQLLDDVYTSGEPFYGNEVKAMVYVKNILKEIYFNFVYQPLKNPDGATSSVMVVATDVSEQVKARKELEKAKDTIDLAIQTSAIGIWTADLGTDLLTFSEQARLVHGLTDGTQLSLKESSQLIQEEFRERVWANIRHAVHTKTNFNEEYWINPMNGGQPRWIRSNGKAYYNEQGKPVYISGTILDLTEQKLDDMRKNDFISMVSHELKTPLTSLTALVQMLAAKANKNGDEFSTGALERANKQVKKMNAMINGFLNISRLESSKIQLNKKCFNLVELIQDVIEELTLTISTHQIYLIPNEPVSVIADYDKIVSVFTNLLTNAVKYSPKGRKVEVSYQKIENQVRVSVKDEGMGIQPKNRQRLFERYFRVDNDESRDISGFGLGLYLSAEIIKRHEGLIWVESESGSGSTFSFSLPLNCE
jgi:two-component system sensor histidine kinase VicK